MEGSSSQRELGISQNPASTSQLTLSSDLKPENLKSEISHLETKSEKHSKGVKDDPVWSILPSYYMYQSTFYGELDPPQYEASSSECDTHSHSHWSSGAGTAATTVYSHSLAASQENSLHVRPIRSNESSSDSNGSLIIADELTNSWRETILDNIHELRNMTWSQNENALSLDMLVHFTEEVGESGKIPKHIDPLNFEYKQGDFLNGYVLIKNTGLKPIPFDMFYVLFEGNFIVANAKDSRDKTPVKIRKFLEMYDFAALWNHASVNRLLLEPECIIPENCDINIDPIDGSHLCIKSDKKILPGELYKRFFTFKIPTRLLDLECNDHNLSGHTELPPTLGISRYEKAGWSHKHQPVDDFSFVDTATNYGVLARFVGKASKYNYDTDLDKTTKLINAEGDEFVILKEQISNVRILQELVMYSDSEKAVNNEASRVLYQNFVNRVKEIIEVGKELKSAISNLDDKSTIDIGTRLAAVQAVQARNQNDSVKARQLYTRFNNLCRDTKYQPASAMKYNIVTPIIKKLVLGTNKPLGTFCVLTPKSEYLLNYISPHRFRYGEKVDDTAWKIQVPIEVEFTPLSLLSKTSQIPEIKCVQAEFVVFTLRSKNRQIPVELNHDFLFKNESVGCSAVTLTDNFTHLVKRPLRLYAKELCDLAHELGTNNFKVEKALVDDLSAMTNLEEKYNNLTLHDVEVECEGQVHPAKKLGKSFGCEKLAHYTRKFSVCVDIAKAEKKLPNPLPLKSGYKSYDEFTLVPSFQTCLLSRMYYLRIMVFLTSEQVVELKVPVTIAKMPTN